MLSTVPRIPLSWRLFSRYVGAACPNSTLSMLYRSSFEERVLHPSLRTLRSLACCLSAIRPSSNCPCYRSRNDIRHWSLCHRDNHLKSSTLVDCHVYQDSISRIGMSGTPPHTGYTAWVLPMPMAVMLLKVTPVRYRYFTASPIEMEV